MPHPTKMKLNLLIQLHLKKKKKTYTTILRVRPDAIKLNVTLRETLMGQSGGVRLSPPTRGMDLTLGSHKYPLL